MENLDEEYYEERFTEIGSSTMEIIEEGDDLELAHSYSSTMFMLPKDIERQMFAVQDLIPGSKVIKLETEPHITVKYGLHTDDVKDVQRKVKDWGPVEVELGDLMVFENPDEDVLVVEIISSDLKKLNRRISQLEHTDSFNEYRPHATIAYLKPGAGRALKGSWPGSGRTLQLDKLVFSPPDDDYEFLALEYSPDQPRGADGKWVAGAGGFSNMKSGKGTKQVLVLKHNADGTFNVKGPKGKVFKNVTKDQLGHKPAAKHVGHPKAPKGEEKLDTLDLKPKASTGAPAGSKVFVSGAGIHYNVVENADGTVDLYTQSGKLTDKNQSMAELKKDFGFKTKEESNKQVEKNAAEYEKLKPILDKAVEKELEALAPATGATFTAPAKSAGHADRAKEFKQKLNAHPLAVKQSVLGKIEKINGFEEGEPIKVPLVTTPDEMKAIQESFPGKEIIKVNANKIIASKSSGSVGAGVSDGSPPKDFGAKSAIGGKFHSVYNGGNVTVTDQLTNGSYKGINDDGKIVTMPKDFVEGKLGIGATPKQVTEAKKYNPFPNASAALAKKNAPDPTPGGSIPGHKSDLKDGGKLDAQLTKVSAAHQAKVDKWTKNLSHAERATIKQWSQSGYHSIRKDEAAGKETETTKAFHSALASAPKFEGTTYRGINVPTSSDAYKMFTTPGAEVKFDSSASTSRSAKQAASFAQGSIVMRIKGKSGVAMEHLSSYKHEKEIIMPHGTKYKVVSVAKNVKVEGHHSATRVVVDLEEI